jgi:hypothetical protein
MNPEGFKLTPSTGPRPPNDVVLHAELTRHGGEFVPGSIAADESAYQMIITPPVSERAPPPNIVLDPAVLQAVSRPSTPRRDEKAQVKEQTSPTPWVSTPGSSSISNLAPPVANIPMSSPGQGASEVFHSLLHDADSGSVPAQSQGNQEGPEARRPRYYDTTKPTCSLNLVCYRSGAKGCDLQQIQCILQSKFVTQESFETTVAADSWSTATPSSSVR